MTQTQVLYRKYRPNSFSDVVGQDQIINVLSHTVKTGQPSHAYLFTGSRGTGKTSTARLFAKELNLSEASFNRFDKSIDEIPKIKEMIDNDQFLDIIEIDAASNRGVGEIRELREKVAFAPSNGVFKVYIIDEVHMLTNEAFNALLKTLEEPPEQTIFIMATTEVHKLPTTILSRVVRFDFQLATKDSLQKKLELICEQEKIDISEEGINLLIKLARGSFRDAESLLEKVIKLSDDSDSAKKGKQIAETEMAAILGASLPEEITSIVTMLAGDKEEELSVYPKFEQIITEIFQRGTNYNQFVQDLIDEIVSAVNLHYSSPKNSPYNIKKLFQLASYVQNFHSRSEYFIDPLMGIKLVVINFLGSQIVSEPVVNNSISNSVVVKSTPKKDIVGKKEENQRDRSVKDEEKNPIKSEDVEQVVQDKHNIQYFSESKDLKQYLMDIFQQKDRRIAGVIGQSTVEYNAGDVKIFVPYKFHLQQLDKIENKIQIREVVEKFMLDNHSMKLDRLEILQAKTSEVNLNKKDINSTESGSNSQKNLDNTTEVEDIFAGLM